MSGSIFTADATLTTVCSANVPSRHMVCRSWPFRWWRAVPSEIW